MLCRSVALLLSAAILPPLIAIAFVRGEDKSGGRFRIDGASSDEEIRRKLLERTPPGTSGADALSFVIDTLQPLRNVTAYSGYIREYKRPKPKKPEVFRTDSRIIFACVAERPVSLLSSERVEARWHFNDNDQLTDITVERMTIGP